MSTEIGRHGTWSNFDRIRASSVVALARRAEALGYDLFWVNESAGREPFGLLGSLAASTERIGLGVGICPIYARDPFTSHAAAATMHELSGGRFVMGLGVSHDVSVRSLREQEYRPPLTAMREFLEAYRRASYRGPLPHGEPPLVVAALRRRMLELAATASDGAFPFLVPVGHVARARGIVDDAAAAAGRPRPLLVVTQPVLLETDPQRARAAGRAHVGGFLDRPNYVRNLLECGFTEEEVASRADRLVDALVGWGDEAAVRARLRAMLDAGADHVALIPLTAEGAMPDAATVEALAPPW